MMITPTQTRITDDHRQDLLAAAARARFVAAAQPTLSTTLQTFGRIRAGLRQAIASLVALASIA